MPDSIDAPLMAGRQDRDDELDYRDADEEADVLPASMKHARQSGPSLFVWLLTFAAGISGLLFGCESQTPSLQKNRKMLTKPFFAQMTQA